MALSELKETAKTLPTEVESTVNSHLEYYKLYIFRIIAKTTMGFVRFLLPSQLFADYCLFLGLCLCLCYWGMVR